jgi:hypothetical protein
MTSVMKKIEELNKLSARLHASSIALADCGHVLSEDKPKTRIMKIKPGDMIKINCQYAVVIALECEGRDKYIIVRFAESNKVVRYKRSELTKTKYGFSVKSNGS